MNETKPNDWIELAKLAQAKFHNRRDHEWKLAFGFWTAIGSFTAAFFTVDGLSGLEWLPWVIGIGYVLIFAVTFSFWQYPMHSAHAGDQEWYVYYMKRATGESSPPPIENPPWKKHNYLWCAGQCSITLIFLAMSWIAITQIAPLKAPPPGQGQQQQKKACLGERVAAMHGAETA